MDLQQKLLRIEQFLFQNKNALTVNEIFNTSISSVKIVIPYNRTLKKANISQYFAKSRYILKKPIKVLIQTSIIQTRALTHMRNANNSSKHIKRKTTTKLG